MSKAARQMLQEKGRNSFPVNQLDGRGSYEGQCDGQRSSADTGRIKTSETFRRPEIHRSPRFQRERS